MENINCSRSYKTLSDGHFEKKPELRYGHLCGFLEAKMVILGPINLMTCKRSAKQI